MQGVYISFHILTFRNPPGITTAMQGTHFTMPSFLILSYLDTHLTLRRGTEVWTNTSNYGAARTTQDFRCEVGSDLCNDSLQRHQNCSDCQDCRFFGPFFKAPNSEAVRPAYCFGPWIFKTNVRRYLRNIGSYSRVCDADVVILL